MTKDTPEQSLRLQVVEGGRQALSPEQSRALSRLADIVRQIPPGQADAVVQLVEEFQRDGYFERVNAFEIPAIKILAEVINGWEPLGVYEFARAWVSTLVARQDGFRWDNCTPKEKDRHRDRILTELARRGY